MIWPINSRGTPSSGEHVRSAHRVSQRKDGKTEITRKSLHLRVLRLSFLKDGDVGVGVFPEREEILVGGERPDAGSISIGSLRGSRRQSIGASHSQMRQGAKRRIYHHARVGR